MQKPKLGDLANRQASLEFALCLLLLLRDHRAFFFQNLNQAGEHLH